MIKDNGATDDEVSLALEIGEELLTERPELRELAVSAAHASALYWLMTGVDVTTMTSIDDRLTYAEAAINHAIDWADAKAIYLSTATQIYMSWRRYDRALEMALQAIQLEPTNPEVVRMLGMAKYATGDLVSAKQLLEEAPELFSRVLRALRNHYE